MMVSRQRLPPEQVAAIARALAEPRRFAMLQQIAAAEQVPCSALAKQQPIAAATISHHVKELAEAGLVRIERDGRSMKLSLDREIWNAYLERLAAI